jgi:hypothetical protein
MQMANQKRPREEKGLATWSNLSEKMVERRKEMEKAMLCQWRTLIPQMVIKRREMNLKAISVITGRLKTSQSD